MTTRRDGDRPERDDPGEAERRLIERIREGYRPEPMVAAQRSALWRSIEARAGRRANGALGPVLGTALAAAAAVALWLNPGPGAVDPARDPATADVDWVAELLDEAPETEAADEGPDSELPDEYETLAFFFLDG